MLSPQRENFAHHFALSGNGTQAAVSAGYSQRSAHVTASRLLRVANVAAAVDAERARMRSKADLKAEDVIAGLRSIAEDEAAPHSSRVQAWRHLGQSLGLFADRLHLETTVTHDVTALQEYTPAQLRLMLEAVKQQEAVEVGARVVD